MDFNQSRQRDAKPLTEREYQQRRHNKKNSRKSLSEQEYWYHQRQSKRASKARLEGQPQKPGGGAGLPRVKQPWKRTKDFHKT